MVMVFVRMDMLGTRMIVVLVLAGVDMVVLAFSLSHCLDLWCRG
jgi:hypothetical protein